MSRYRFALGPKWILSHLFVLALVVAMINLGLWQIRRLDQRKATNRRYRERTTAPAVPLASLLTARSSNDDVKPLQYRRVTVEGTYRADQEVLVRGRSQNQAPGSWVLTPLVLADGTGVVVNRGWIGNPGTFTSVPTVFRAPGGRVTVTGLIQETETRGSFGSRDPASGTLTDLARADIGRIQRQVSERLVPGWVQLEQQVPAHGRNNPHPLDPPPLDEGPHFSYAVQWFIFTTIAIGGYPLILRRRAREIEIEGSGDGADLDRPDPDDDEPVDDDPRLDPIDGRSAPPTA